MTEILFHSLIGYALIDRLVQEAMSGRFLDSNFSLPCPPGLDIPPEVLSPFTSNNLKVNLYTTSNQHLVCWPRPPPSSYRPLWPFTHSPLYSLPVPAVAGLLRLFLVSLLHTGGHAGPCGPQGPPLPTQKMGRTADQEGTGREGCAGLITWGAIWGRRGAWLRGGVARSGGVWGQRDAFKWTAAGNIALSQMMSQRSVTVLMGRPFTLPTHTGFNLICGDVDGGGGGHSVYWQVVCIPQIRGLEWSAMTAHTGALQEKDWKWTRSSKGRILCLLSSNISPSEVRSSA